MAHYLGDSYRPVRGSENAIFMDGMIISIAHNGSGVTFFSAAFQKDMSR
jgi:hypothetical protein